MHHEIAQRVEKLVQGLSLGDLMKVNRMIVERIKLLQRAAAMNSMGQFKIGETVSFTHHGRMVRGRIIKFNLKTVTLITDDDHTWNVSPALLLRPVEQ
ncbi:MAG: hypothetical protein QME74_12005 [Candidatus Edwardsbacteria bacterium]|nr:hypothetical protein [Candidatus Edwardsbacteria bacterium]